MIFLKKIEAKGFKSYANLTTIEFHDGFVGIVGENGSGKTNIVDAIRWVLGNVSNKQLRSENSYDVIFYGSDKYDPLDTATVSLFFDNSTRILKIDDDEVVVKRILKKNSDTSEYYLNNNLVRKKDIIDLFLDTGLSKGSLGIISQGTVQSFVEARPDERRVVFEEAAGIGKYTKTKNQHISELQNVEKNLSELEISAHQYENIVKKLENQASIAKQYIEVKNQLEKYELIDIKRKYLHYNGQIEILNDSLNTINNSLDTINEKLIINKEILKNLAIQKNKQEEENSISNQKKYVILEEINRLNIEKSNYENNLKNQLNSSDVNLRIQALNQIISDLRNEEKIWSNNYVKIEQEIKVLNQQKKDINDSELQKSDEINKYKNILEELSVKKKYLTQLIDNEYKNENAVRVLLENKNAISGLIDPLNKLIKNVHTKYIKAIDLALGRNLHTIVVKSSHDAKIAIEFLKKNNAGIASFMPLDSIKNFPLPNQILTIAQNFAGYINTADKLVDIDEQYYPVIKNLIGNILIVNELKDANLIAKAIEYSARIISLDGEIVNRGGMIIGGSQKQKISSLNMRNEYEKISNDYEEIKKKLSEIEINYSKLLDEKNSISDKYTSLIINLNTSKDKKDNITNELNKYEIELSTLNQKDNIEKIKAKSNSIIDKLAILETQKNEIINKLNIQENSYRSLKQKYEELSENINNENEEIINLTNKKIKIENDLSLAKNIIYNAKSLANSYSYTIERILDDIKDIEMNDNVLHQNIYELRSKLQSFGPINMEAIKDLEENKIKLDELNKNIQEIKIAQEHLLEIIKNLDKEVSKIFRNKIFEINKKLPEVFEKLFKNGKCELRFTDPEDLLNTGIEIYVKPAGKQIRKLNVLSGGEKSLISLSVLLTIVKISNFPLTILDEAESALDPNHVELLSNLFNESKKYTQLLVVTHRKETMIECDKLLGAVQKDGITSMYSVNINDIKED